MDNRPIGVFDSGVGGISVMREIMALLPREDIVYFGDTGRVPYGGRSRETIVSYAVQDINYLLSHDVKMIVAACGTVSSTLPAAVYDKLPVPYLNIINSSVQTACALSQNGRIGVIATAATIRTNAFGRSIRSVRPEFHVFGAACPLFVPLVENGHVSENDEITALAAKLYLEPLKAQKIDTLILGCTHYPMLYDIINRELSYSVTLIDPGHETAKAVQSYLTVNSLLCESEAPGRHSYFMTDSAEDFCSVASVFLSADIRESATQVSIV